MKKSLITSPKKCDGKLTFSLSWPYVVERLLLLAYCTVAEPKLGHFLYQTKMCADPTLFMVHIIHHSLPLTFILITQETRSLKTF